MKKLQTGRATMPALSTICASVLLAACGGGDGMSAAGSTAGAEGSDSHLLAKSGLSSWIRCASEWGTCSFTGTRQVRYGANGKWVYKTFTSTAPCTTTAFGSDPSPNTAKVCENSSATTTDPAPAPTTTTTTPTTTTTTPTTTTTATWTRCSSEWALCTVSGTKQVRYGANTSWLYRTVTNSIGCNSDAFGGDPAPGTAKVCDYTDSTTQTTTDSAPTPDTTTTTTTTSPAPAAGAITDIRVTSSSSAAQTNVPVTFGQTFIQGAVMPTDSLVGNLGNGVVIPLQVDAKATHPDGSLRHAVISAVIPQLAAGQTYTVSLLKGTAATASSATTATALLTAGFTASVNVNVGGVVYTASADSLLKSSYTTWLSGPVAGEWLVSAPLKTAQGVSHPHLTARFAIRAYNGLNKARVDVTIENDWAYEPNPQNFTYDTQVLVGGQTVYSNTALKHFHHARWHKQFWWGASPQTNVRHNGAYLMATKAVPNYDPNVNVSEAGLAALASRLSAADASPMGPGIVNRDMPMAGGRPDIGPLPQWTAMYLMSMDVRAKNATITTGDMSGSWPIHYRDKKTDRPVSLADYPYMTLLGNPGDTVNPTTGQSEAFPACTTDCVTNYNPDSAHQPSLAYIPYLTTGDYFYLEELQFWANWNMFRHNPYYRDFTKGLLKMEEVRGQAWSLRTLGQAAYITPDNHPMKQYFTDRIADNLNWYNTTYTAANPNQLGVIDGSGQYAFAGTVYTTASGAQTGVATWQDDFFTWSVGYLSDLGINNALPLLKWKAKFPVGRMTAAGYCWIDASTYSLSVRPSSTSPLFTNFTDAYRATMRNPDGSVMVNSTGAQYLAQACASQAQADWRTQKDKDLGNSRTPWLAGEMDGWAYSAEGYPSNMQPALAAASSSGIANAATAWSVFMSRSVKPDYSSAPQWAIIPR